MGIASYAFDLQPQPFCHQNVREFQVGKGVSEKGTQPA